MLIDWFTVAAQLLNFVILIALLKRFLYQPILQALDAREHRISAELSEADAKKQQAQAEYEQFCQKNQEFDLQRAELFKTASEEAKTERQRLLTEARIEADNLRSQRQQALAQEVEVLMTSLTRQIQTEVFAITRQVLTDLADVNLENQMIAVFMEKLRSSDPEIVSVLKNTATPLLLRTAFTLSEAQQLEIQQTIAKIAGSEIELQLTTEAKLISGIELSSVGQKIVWTLADYLGNVENNLKNLLQQHIDVDKPEKHPTEFSKRAAEDVS